MRYVIIFLLVSVGLVSCGPVKGSSRVGTNPEANKKESECSVASVRKDSLENVVIDVYRLQACGLNEEQVVSGIR